MNNLTQKQRYTSLSNKPFPLLIPLIVVLAGLFIYPMVEVVRYSFTNIKFGKETFDYTLNSYSAVISDRFFLSTLGVTTIFVFFSVLFQLLNGFIIAFALYMGEKLKVKGSVFVRTCVIVSMAIPGVIIGVIWRMIFDESPAGIVNYYIKAIGVGSVRFLTDPNIALVSVIIANIWRGTASSMILIYAGLKTVPESTLEAGAVDGANGSQLVTKIIVPSIKPIVLICGLLSIIGTFNTFDMIMSLTGGGPAKATEVLALSSYNEIFTNFNLGRGSAIAVIILLINLVMAGIYFYLNKKEEN